MLPKITDKSATPTDSAISIADLLEYVNRYFPDILPESALRHYGHTERPDGTLVESVLFSEKDYGTSAYDLVGEHKTLEKRYKQLAADFENYKERVKLDRTLTKGRVMKQSELEAVARYLIKQGDSNYKVFELAKILNDLYVDLQDGAMLKRSICAVLFKRDIALKRISVVYRILRTYIALGRGVGC